MKKTLLLLIIQFVSCVAVLSSQNADNPLELREKLDTFLSQGVEKGFSGAVLVAREGEVILNKGYGLANREHNIPYTSTTVSTIGSVTKQFTATAILKLEELGRLDVEDQLDRYFDRLPHDKKEITIHQLLTHTSGLRSNMEKGDFNNLSTNRFFKAVFSTELLHEPGTIYHYSNLGYSILARIIEVVTDEDYELFLQKHLFLPAGMSETGYFIPSWDDHLIATGYARNIHDMGSVMARLKKIGGVPWALKGNGGIHSTTGDMFKWYQALRSNLVLSEESFKKLTEPHVAEGEDESSFYAYGWAIYPTDTGSNVISHNGGNSIFFHEFIWSPLEEVVVILFTNAGNREAEVTWSINKMIADRKLSCKAHKEKSIPVRL